MVKNILEYLEQTVIKVPNKIAFSNGEESLTFSQLYNTAKVIGSNLLRHGFSREPIFVVMEKHPNAIAAFLGAIYAGCFYVPIDSEMPALRIQSIISTVRGKIIISDKKNINVAESTGIENILEFDTLANGNVDDILLEKIRKDQLDIDPIYVVFTSGSTGVPKGVLACHRSVIDYTDNLSAALEFDSYNIFGNQTPLFFDAPLKEIMPTLKFGATTYFIPKKLFMFPVKLIEYLNQYKINTICWVVSALTMISSLGAFQKAIPKYLTTIAFGSEVFPIKQFRIWREALPDATFYNLYGPTEATGMSCWYRVDREFSENESIPIGKPFSNTRILLIRDDGKEALSGECGEMYISGTCVTQGYYSNLEKTDDAFVQNPLIDKSLYRDIVYKTGDIARKNDNDDLIFISRKDFQIKHMGHRIELGEIESAADTFDGVARSCCIYDKDKKKIYMFYIGDSEQSYLMKYLRDYLPRYMIPNQIQKLDTLPLTPNGKIDRRALENMIK